MAVKAVQSVLYIYVGPGEGYLRGFLEGAVIQTAKGNEVWFIFE
jgi:hypothetical protein